MVVLLPRAMIHDLPENSSRIGLEGVNDAKELLGRELINASWSGCRISALESQAALARDMRQFGDVPIVLQKSAGWISGAMFDLAQAAF